MKKYVVEANKSMRKSYIKSSISLDDIHFDTDIILEHWEEIMGDEYELDETGKPIDWDAVSITVTNVEYVGEGEFEFTFDVSYKGDILSKNNVYCYYQEGGYDEWFFDTEGAECYSPSGWVEWQ